MGKKANEKNYRRSGTKLAHFAKRRKRSKKRGLYRTNMVSAEHKAQDERLLEMIKELEQI